MWSWKTKSKLPVFPAGSSASKICIFTNIYENLYTHKNLAVLVTLIDQDLRCLQVLAWDIFCGIQQVSSHLARSDEAWRDEKMQGLSTSSTAMGPPKLLHVNLSGLKPHLLTSYYTRRAHAVGWYCLDTMASHWKMGARCAQQPWITGIFWCCEATVGQWAIRFFASCKPNLVGLGTFWGTNCETSGV